MLEMFALVICWHIGLAVLSPLFTFCMDHLPLFCWWLQLHKFVTICKFTDFVFMQMDDFLPWGWSQTPGGECSGRQLCNSLWSQTLHQIHLLCVCSFSRRGSGQHKDHQNSHAGNRWVVGVEVFSAYDLIDTVFAVCVYVNSLLLWSIMRN